MQCGFIVFDNLTALDFVGAYDPLTRLRTMNLMPDFRWRVCALSEEVKDDRGLGLRADHVGQALDAFDVIVVAGGWGTRELVTEDAFLAWLKTADRVPLKASVCTGSLLLGAAGWLRDRRATTHPSALAQLAPYCRETVAQRIVDEGDVVTSGGVTAAIDLGLHLVQRLAGVDVARVVATQMDYQIQPFCADE